MTYMRHYNLYFTTKIREQYIDTRIKASPLQMLDHLVSRNGYQVDIKSMLLVKPGSILWPRLEKLKLKVAVLVYLSLLLQPQFSALSISIIHV